MGSELVQADSGATDSSEKVCLYCGSVFAKTTNAVQKYCCHACKAKHREVTKPPHVKRASLPDITLEQLRHYLTYHPEIGQFTWNVRCGRATVGTIAGTVQSKGYIYINVLRRIYGAHRLAWMWCYGYLPMQPLDHKNGNKADNRIDNLRLATNSENVHSRVKGMPLSGIRGVSKSGNKWRAQIGFLGENRLLGTFDTKEEAASAYRRASLDLFGPFSVVHLSNEAVSDQVRLNQTSLKPSE